MKAPWIFAWCAVLASLIAGTIADSPSPNPRVELGGYDVLAGDFHVHSFPWSWATLDPLDTVMEAGRRNLDVIAMTPHNHLWVAKMGRRFSRATGGPLVLVGEEIHSLHYHILGIGLTKTVSWNQSAAHIIEEVHRQGGVAIAAHPVARFWTGYDAEAMRLLDGAEVLHPLALTYEDGAAELRQFYERKRMTAIGDTDYRGLGPIGLCRTWVFVKERTERGVLDALREGRTVVYDRDHVYGDPALIQLAAADGRLPTMAVEPKASGLLARFSRITGILGLVVIALM